MITEHLSRWHTGMDREWAQGVRSLRGGERSGEEMSLLSQHASTREMGPDVLDMTSITLACTGHTTVGSDRDGSIGGIASRRRCSIVCPRSLEDSRDKCLDEGLECGLVSDSAAQVLTVATNPRRPRTR